MAPRIADQVHRVLKARDDEHCRERERVTGKKVQRKNIQVPVVRLGPDALCQNIEYLLLVSEYDYDLSDSQFQDYCSARGTLHVAGVPGSTRWKYLADHTLAKDEYRSDPYFQFAQEFEGKRHKYSPDEVEVLWKVMLLGRATLQDCWELYTRK